MELFTITLISYCVVRKTVRQMEKEKTCEKVRFSFVYPDIQQSIDESLAVINKTKDVEAGIKGFAVIKSNLAKLAAVSPFCVRITLQLGDKEICREIEIGSSSGNDSISKLEKKWMRNFFCEKFDTLVKQSEESFDPVLNVELMREAARTALKGLEYLPDDELLKIKVDLAERRLGFFTDSVDKQVKQ